MVADRESERIIVDLAEVTFIDAAAVGAILEGYVAAQRVGTALRLVNATGIVARVFEVLDLMTLFDNTNAD